MPGPANSTTTRCSRDKPGQYRRRGGKADRTAVASPALSSPWRFLSRSRRATAFSSPTCRVRQYGFFGANPPGFSYNKAWTVPAGGRCDGHLISCAGAPVPPVRAQGLTVWFVNKEKLHG